MREHDTPVPRIGARARRRIRARATAEPPGDRAQALLALQADAGNRAVTGSLAARTPSPGVLQRVIRVADDARVMQPKTAQKVHAYLRAEDIYAADNPKLAELVDEWIAEPGNRDYRDEDRLVVALCGELIERYRRTLTERGAPTVVSSLGHGHKNGLALLVAIGGYDPALLFGLLAQAQATPNIDAASLTRTVGKYLSPVNDPTAYLRRGVVRDYFLMGRPGQMIGFVGELQAALAAARANSARRVEMGRDVAGRSEAGADVMQDVDLYFVSGGREHCFEVAANVDVLREKTKAGNAQMGRYESIRRAKPSVVLGYAVGQPCAWANVFRGEHLVERLVSGSRSLQVDGVVWTPPEIVAIQERVRFLMRSYGRYRAEALFRALATFTADEFAALPDAKVASRLGHALPAHGRDIQQAVLVGKARDAVHAINVAAAGALRVVESRGSGDSHFRTALDNLQKLWDVHRAKLLAGLSKLAELPQPADAKQLEKAAKVVRTGLGVARSALLEQLTEEGKNAPPRSAAYTHSTLEQARETFEVNCGEAIAF